MKYLNIFVILFSLFPLISCRSLDTNMDRSEMDENEYEADDSEDKEDIDNDIQAEEKGDEKLGINEEQLIDFSGNTYLQRLAEARSARANTDPKAAENYKNNILDAETDDRISASRAQLQPKIGMFNKCVNKLNDMKKGFQGTNDYYIIDNSGSNEQQKYKNKIQDTNSKRKYDEHLSDIRTSKKGNNKQSQTNDDREKRNANSQRNANSEEKFNNDDVAIIKEHIKRLSKDEFNDLLHSLSDSNVELLKNIFDGDDQIHVSKRDITKKAGAIADSILNDNNQLDFKDKVPESISELQPETTACSKVVQKKNIELQESVDTIKENELSNTTLAAEINKSAPSTDQSSDNNTISDQSKIKMELCNDIKLKTSGLVEDFDNNYSQQLSVDYPNYFYNDLSKIAEYNTQEDNKNKREINDNLKFLEDSFPKSNNINDNYLNTPLVRVKRRNQQVLKREHNTKCNKINFKDGKESYSGYDDSVSNHIKQGKHKSTYEAAEEAGSSSIGSDTDNVLTKVEGVDDNIMFNNGDQSQKSFNYYSEDDIDKYINENEKSMSQK